MFSKFFRYISIGFLVGLGLFLALQIGRYVDHRYITPYYQKEAEKNYPRAEQNLLEPSSINIESSRIIEANRNFSISVKVKNTLEYKIASAHILISLFDSEGLFGRCSNWASNLGALESKEILVDCHEFNKTKIPLETKYEIEINNVLRKHEL